MNDIFCVELSRLNFRYLLLHLYIIEPTQQPSTQPTGQPSIQPTQQPTRQHVPRLQHQ